MRMSRHALISICRYLQCNAIHCTFNALVLLQPAAGPCTANTTDDARAVAAAPAGPAAGDLARHGAECHGAIQGDGEGRALPAGAGRRRLQGRVQYHSIALPRTAVAVAPCAGSMQGRGLQGRLAAFHGRRRRCTGACLCRQPSLIVWNACTCKAVWQCSWQLLLRACLAAGCAGAASV